MRASLLFFVSIVAVTAAVPFKAPQSHVTLPLARVFNLTGSATLAAVDRSRAKTLVGRTQPVARKADGTPVSVSVTNFAISYIASIGVGTPPTYYDLIVDTGSSNTWVGAHKAYVETSSSSDTGNLVAVEYGSGVFFGEEYTDTVTIGSLSIDKQGIGSAFEADGFQSYVDGILGLGPVDMTVGTLFPDDTATVPTVTDNAFDQGSIPVDSLGVYFQPITGTSAQTNGELTFGGVDDSKIEGTLSSFPITTTSPASNYWGIDLSVAYGTTSILGTTAGILDTGTTLILLASDAFAAYQAATGATLDPDTDMLMIDQDKYDALQDLRFTVHGVDYVLTPNAQIWPRALNAAIGGTDDGIYLVVTDIGTPSGQGLDFITGQTFLERFYSYHDTTNKLIGLGYTHHTTDETN